MSDTTSPPLTWRRDHLRPDEFHGYCYDGDMAVGTVAGNARDYPAPDTWTWNLLVTGVTGWRDMEWRGLVRGKENAKAAVEAAYGQWLAAHPDNRAAALAHHAACQKRDRMWEERGSGIAERRDATYVRPYAPPPPDRPS